jgi:hypothetical protein
MTTSCNEITAGLWLQYTWRQHEGPNPLTWRSADEWDARKKEEAAVWQALKDEIRSVAPSLEKAANELHERFGLTPLVREQRAKRAAAPRSTWPGWHEPRDVIAIAMGAPEPLRLNGMWWHDRNHYALELIQSAAELARLEVPNWQQVQTVQQMLDSLERWQRARPGEPAPDLGILWENLITPQGEVTSICHPSFVDLGLYLMGATRFFTVLAGEPQLADAFMDFCFDLSTSYVGFLLGLNPVRFVGLCDFGGDATFFLSPKLYDRYSAAWDARMFDHVRTRYRMTADLPCNLHSCGASSHLYERWGQHPCRANITVMQTRLIPGTVGQLRSSLPKTRLELTLHPPQFDLAGAEPGAIRDVLRQSAAQAGGLDAHFGFITAVHRPEDLPRLARNVEVVLEEIDAIRTGRRN